MATQANSGLIPIWGRVTKGVGLPAQTPRDQPPCATERYRGYCSTHGRVNALWRPLPKLGSGQIRVHAQHDMPIIMPSTRPATWRGHAADLALSRIVPTAVPRLGLAASRPSGVSGSCTQAQSSVQTALTSYPMPRSPTHRRCRLGVFARARAGVLDIFPVLVILGLEFRNTVLIAGDP